MIYIVEVPHYYNPLCWAANDEVDAINILSTSCRLLGQHDSVPSVNAPFSEWMSYNRAELYTQYVFMTTEEAIAGIDTISGHNAVLAQKALVNAMEGHEQITIDNRG